jgi:hypothetical protein
MAVGPEERDGLLGGERRGGRRVGRGPNGEGKGVWGLFFVQFLFKQLFKLLF